MSAQRSQALRNSAAARSIAAEQRARHAIAELDRRGQPITFLAVAAEAGVSARYLYAHPQLRATIEQIRDEQHRAPSRPPRHPRANDESIRARLRGALGGAQATPRRERPAARRARTRTRRDPRAQARKPPKEHEMSEWPAPDRRAGAPRPSRRVRSAHRAAHRGRPDRAA